MLETIPFQCTGNENKCGSAAASSKHLARLGSGPGRSSQYSVYNDNITNPSKRNVAASKAHDSQTGEVTHHLGVSHSYCAESAALVHLIVSLGNASCPPSIPKWLESFSTPSLMLIAGESSTVNSVAGTS